MYQAASLVPLPAVQVGNRGFQASLLRTSVDHKEGLKFLLVMGEAGKFNTLLRVSYVYGDSSLFASVSLSLLTSF